MFRERKGEFRGEEERVRIKGREIKICCSEREREIRSVCRERKGEERRISLIRVIFKRREIKNWCSRR